MSPLLKKLVGIYQATEDHISQPEEISRTARLVTDRFTVPVFRISLTEIYSGRRTFKITDYPIIRIYSYAIMHTNIKINTHKYSYALKYF